MRCLRFCTFLLGLLSLASCQNRARVLPADKFADVLTDVYITESLLKEPDRKTKNAWNRGLSDIYFQDLSYRRILDKHHISEADFYASVDHYGHRNKEMVKILTKVEANMSDLRQEVETRFELIQAEKDRLEFERRWKTVCVDTAYVGLWANWLAIEADTAYWQRVDSALDTLLRVVRVDFYRNDWAYLDSLAAYLDSLRLDSLRLDSLRLDSLLLDSLRLDSLRLDSLRLDSLRLDSLRTDSLRLDSLRLDSLRQNSLPSDSSELTGAENPSAKTSGTPSAKTP